MVRTLATLAVLATALVCLAVIVGRPDAAPRAGRATTSAIAGIPQDGITLGRPDAPVTLVEYADVQCPFCAVYANAVLPTVVDRYVRTGRIKLELRVLAFLGPDSVKAARALAASGQQDKLWGLSEQLAARQGAENSGWVTDALLRDAMRRAGIDADRAQAATDTPAVTRALARDERAARRDGVRGTPAFFLQSRGGTRRPLLPTDMTPAAFTTALDAALAAR